MASKEELHEATAVRRAVPALGIALVAAALILPTAIRAQQPASGLKADLLADLDEVAEKTISLAEAMPAEKYGWRPEEGVRSVGEVYVHVAGANRMFARMASATPDAGARAEMPAPTDKARVVEALRTSFATLRSTIEATPGDAWDRRVKMFGSERSLRDVFLLAVTHVHEHLGQSIAYARMNGVVPPWSRPKE